MVKPNRRKSFLRKLEMSTTMVRNTVNFMNFMRQLYRNLQPAFI